MKLLIREELRRGAEETAVAQWRELVQHLPDTSFDPATLVRLVPCIRREDGDEPARMALQRELAREGQPPPPPVLIQLARLAAELDPELGARTARVALESEGLNETQRAEAQALLQLCAKPDMEPLEPDEPPLPPPPAELPKNAFYEETDRSAFAEIDELGELALDADDDVLEVPAEPIGRALPAVPLVAAQPQSLDRDALVLKIDDDQPVRLPYERIRAVAVAAVRGLGPRPVALIDLVLDAALGAQLPMQLVRLRSDQFDPRALAPGQQAPIEALRFLIEQLLERTGATPLPDAASARANPIRMFDSLDAYTEQVLPRSAPK